MNKVNIKTNFWQKLDLFYSSEFLLWIIIFFGVFLRLDQYFLNRSLWVDEAALALNIVNKSFWELLSQPLDYQQGAPVGFLLASKLAVITLGNNEYVLRLIPLLAGLASLILVKKVSSYYLETKAIPLALTLFAILQPLIYYSSELKQYSWDVFIALLLFSLAIYLQPQSGSTAGILTFKKLILGSLVGGIAVWCSHPSIFILAGVGSYFFLNCIIQKNRESGFKFLLMGIFWLISFYGFYHVSLRELTQNQGLFAYWNLGFIPFPPLSRDDFGWYLRFIGIFRNPLGFSVQIHGLAALAFLIGFLSMFLEKKRKFLTLTFPLLFLFLASILHKYPFKERLILFGTPFMILFISEGIEQVINKILHKSFFMRMILNILLIIMPFSNALSYIGKPYYTEEIKPVLKFMKKHWQSGTSAENGDFLYLYYGANRAFHYYLKDYDFYESEYFVGSNLNYQDEIKSLCETSIVNGKKRVWILFSHHSTSEEKAYLQILDNLGKMIISSSAEGASVYLYDLSLK